MKIKFVVIVLLVAFFVSGCVSYPAMLDKSFPSSEKYSILGPVFVTGTTICFLGLPFGGIRYADLLGTAIEKYKSVDGVVVDDVVSVSVDKEVKSVFGIVTYIATTIRGIAIQYTDKLPFEEKAEQLPVKSVPDKPSSSAPESFLPR